jgi:hypothetical protein
MYSPAAVAENQEGFVMQIEVKRPIKKAVHRADKTAKAQNQLQLSESYRKDRRLSNLKLQLGEFLFFLQMPLRPYERKVCLQALERTLQEFYQIEGTRQ